MRRLENGVIYYAHLTIMTLQTSLKRDLRIACTFRDAAMHERIKKHICTLITASSSNDQVFPSQHLTNSEYNPPPESFRRKCGQRHITI
jgi:hypothetical protein